MTARSWTWAWVLLAVAAGAPARAASRVAPTAVACKELVGALTDRVTASPWNELQLRVMAYRISGQLTDALGKRLPHAERWRSGNAFWEETQALLEPDLLAHMRSAGEAEAQHMKETVPRHLVPKTCGKYLSLRATPLGETAERIREASETEKMLVSLRGAFEIPQRLQPWEEKVRQSISEGMALERDPEIARQQPQLEKVRLELRGYEKEYVAAVKKADGGAERAEQQKGSSDAAAQMIARRKDALLDVFRRYQVANPP